MTLSPLGIALNMQPNVAAPPRTGVNPTDVTAAYGLSANMAEQQYQAKLAQQNATWGGLAGLGSAGMLAFGPKLAGLFSPSAAGAAIGKLGATAAAPSVAAADWSLPTLSGLGIDTGLGTAGLTGAGDVAGSIAAGTAAAAAPAVADAGAMSLADLLPFLALA
jgi:hypothetical protein